MLYKQGSKYPPPSEENEFMMLLDCRTLVAYTKEALLKSVGCEPTSLVYVYEELFKRILSDAGVRVVDIYNSFPGVDRSVLDMIDTSIKDAGYWGHFAIILNANKSVKVCFNGQSLFVTTVKDQL